MSSDLTVFVFPKASYPDGTGYPQYFDVLNQTGQHFPQNDAGYFATEISFLARAIGLPAPDFHWFQMHGPHGATTTARIGASLTLQKEWQAYLTVLQLKYSVRDPAALRPVRPPGESLDL